MGRWRCRSTLPCACAGTLSLPRLPYRSVHPAVRLRRQRAGRLAGTLYPTAVGDATDGL